MTPPPSCGPLALLAIGLGKTREHHGGCCTR
eukprot:CAMPEP_0205939476 /NCGR_PEP_ID=MMETSP1325-20131115/49730_1 /ASSEMBLY_ACC=CAM_ASM_000708 /TAXON_ID=236786 /ORGANISM="Florenciella sp., Strain RCC1007" /LENGTH=30 /DNA_ID= /DNA_START= /DNA_END= /DNA_ORIENTATION=